MEIHRPIPSTGKAREQGDQWGRVQAPGGLVIQGAIETHGGRRWASPYSQDLRERVIAAVDDG
jgi:hypothetical protein